MIITELFYNDTITGESVSEKKVQQIEPSDTINDISEHSHLTAKQIMAHLDEYFDCIFITSPKTTMAELSHFIPLTVTELCDFMKLYIPEDDFYCAYGEKKDGLGETKQIVDNVPTVDTIEIPKNVTNGNMIKIVFPNIEIEGIGGEIKCIATQIGFGTSYFALDWWNAPYKKGGEE